MPLGFIEANFLGTVFEGVFYGNLYYICDIPMTQFMSSLGLYCIIFFLYLHVHTSKRCDERSLLVYPISSLFVLCTAFFALDLTQEYLIVVSKNLLPNPVYELMHINTRRRDKENTTF